MYILKEDLIAQMKSIGTSNRMMIVMKNSDTSLDGRKPRIDFACERNKVYCSIAKLENLTD